MEKIWIVAVITVGAFVSVSGLQCYSCTDCSSSQLTDSQLVTCGDINVTDTNNINTKFLGVLKDIETKLEMECTCNGIDCSCDKEGAVPKVSRNTFVCAVITITGPNNREMITRTCAVPEVCDMPIPQQVKCETCTTDKCNGAYTMHHSAAVLFLALTSLFVINKK